VRGLPNDAADADTLFSSGTLPVLSVRKTARR